MSAAESEGWDPDEVVPLSAYEPELASDPFWEPVEPESAMAPAPFRVPRSANDRRLLVVEGEFARVLAVAARDGSTLSPIVRDAWDTGTLKVTTRREPLRANGAHISIIGHITIAEAREKLTNLDAVSGFANRFLFTMSRRSKLLPSGGSLREQDRRHLSDELRSTLSAVRSFGILRRSPEAESRWAELYEAMADEEGAGLVGAVTARAEAQTLRLSVAYALLDRSRTIEPGHLESAYAVWSYCRDSAAYLFGDGTGDEIADRLLAGLREAGPDGLDGTAQRDLFHRHAPKSRLEKARQVLALRGLTVTDTEETGGRPRIVTRLTDSALAAPTPEWPALKPEAFAGLAGRVVDTIDPHTESDPAALLLDLLTAFGNAVGPGPHAIADAAPHPARLFTVIVGETSKARKGTSRRNIEALFDEADPGWAQHRTTSGLASGEGLIAAVANPPEDDKK